MAEILGNGESDAKDDEKNIRRRVYDALNVLLAMDMIAKDKKEIRWIGLPNNTAVGLESIRAKKEEKQQELERKQQQYKELCLQKTAYERIIARNQENPTAVPEHKRIYMPFIVVKTNKNNNIDCEVTEDYHEIFFNFTSNFEILNDMEILKKMGYHKDGAASPAPAPTAVQQAAQ